MAGRNKGNVRDHPLTGHAGAEVQYRCSSTLSLTTALYGMGGQQHAPAAFPPRESPGTRCTAGWLGHRAGLGRVRKISPPPGFDPRTFQPVASRTNTEIKRTKTPQTNKQNNKHNEAINNRC